MTPKEYLKLKGYTPEAIVCNDWNKTISAFDIEEMLEDYHQSKLKDNEVLDPVIWRCTDDITDLLGNTDFTKGLIYEQVKNEQYPMMLIDNYGNESEVYNLKDSFTSI